MEKFHTSAQLAMPTRAPSVRKFWGFSGQPLLAPENVPVPQQMRQRFQQAGLESFLPYADPFQTLAQGTGYRQAANDLRIADTEQDFLDNLDSISQAPNGLQSFLQKNPAATFSPMVQTWAKMRQPVTKDPYEDEVATAGSKYLDSYRKARQAGTDPAAAFAVVRDTITKDKEGAKAQEDEELWFVEKGGDLSDLPTLKGKSKAERLQHIRDKGIPLNSTESGKLAELQSELETATGLMEYGDSKEEQERYKADVKTALGGRDPVTREDWDAGYAKLKAGKVGPAQKALETYLGALSEMNKRIPGQSPSRAQTPAAAPVAPAPANVLPAAQAPPAVDEGAAVIPPPDAAPVPTAPPAAPAPSVTPPASAPTAKAPSRYGFSFKTYGEKNPGPIERIIEEVEPFFEVGGNVTANLKNDPLGRVSDAIIGSDERSPISSPPPTEQDHVSRWSGAKKQVGEHFKALGISEEEIKEKLGSLVVEDKVPIDYFLPKGSKDGTADPNLRVPAGVAFLSALAKKKGLTPGPAFRGKDGNVSWLDVAKTFAQDELHRFGELKMADRESPPATTARPSAPASKITVGQPRKVQ
jgi:hypothetical protein